MCISENILLFGNSKLKKKLMHTKKKKVGIVLRPKKFPKSNFWFGNVKMRKIVQFKKDV